MKNIKLQLYKQDGKGVEGYLTLTKESNLPITFSLADIQDITKKKSISSKSIELAGTKENNILLGNIYDINLDTFSFNINHTQKCAIVIDGDILLDNCLLQLTDIVKIQNNSLNDFDIKYTVNIKSSNADFFTNIKQRELTDVLLTKNEIPNNNFTFNSTNIINSFDNTIADGYKYLIPSVQFTNNNEISIGQFKLALYAKTFFDKIITDSGFRYTFEEIGVVNSVKTGNDTLNWDKLLIPYTSKQTSQTLSDVDIYKTEAYNSTPQNIVLYDINGYLNSSISEEIIYKFNNIIQNDSNSYNPSTGNYTALFGGKANINIKTNTDFIVNSNWSETIIFSGNKFFPKANGTHIGNINVYQNILINGTPISGEAFKIGAIKITQGQEITNGSFNLGNITNEINYAVQLIPTDVITIKTYFKIETFDSSVLLVLKSSPTTEVSPANITATINRQDLLFTPTLFSDTQSFGNIINVNNFIPKKIKQSDFIKSLLTMFNVFVYTDKEDDNLLIFKTRDKFYDDGKYLDLTQSLIKDKEQTRTKLSQSEKKRKVLTYNPDKDAANNSYKAETNENYGQATFIFDDENIIDESENKILFSPTPYYLNNNTNMYLSYLSDESNIRILFDGGKQTCNNYTLVNYAGNFVNSNEYSVATHFDNPINPSFDLNFSACPNYFTLPNSITNNNLFNLYWRRTFYQLNNGWMLEAYFNIDDEIIKNLILNERIIIDNSVYYINSIIDYNPTKTSIVKIQLISIDDLANSYKGITIRLGDLTGVKIKTVFGTGVKNPFLEDNMVADDIVIDTENSSGIGNIINATHTIVNGNGNIVSGIGSKVNGNFNTSNGAETTIFGNNNNIISGIGSKINGNFNTSTGKETTIFGDNNINVGDNNVLNTNDSVVNDANNIIILQEGITASDSGTLYSDNISSENLIVERIIVDNTIITPVILLDENPDYNISINSDDEFVKSSILINKDVGDYSIKSVSDVPAIASGDYSLAIGKGAKATGNSTIALGDGVEGANDNTLYLNKLNIKSIPSGTIAGNVGYDSNGNIIQGIISSSNVISDTYTNILNLKNASNLTPGSIYFLTDRNIWVVALTTNSFALDAQRSFRIIKDSFYTPATSIIPGVDNYIGIYGQTFARGSYPNSAAGTYYYAIWGGRMWRRSSGGSDVTGSANDVIAGGWTMVNTTDIYVYESKIFDIKYNFDDDIIWEQSDDRGNKIKRINNTTSYIDITDWGNTNIYNNENFGIFNNLKNSTTRASVYRNSNSGYIFNNSNDGEISHNSNYGFISNNKNKDISNNSNYGNISYNVNNGYISNNTNYGFIDHNSNNISIFNNSNNGFIYNNSNIGEISYNSNIGPIYDNTNNNIISYNSNIGRIYNNSNSGTIYNNSNTDGIANNSNSGSISANSNSGNIESNSNYNVGIISHNSNNGNISNNTNQDEIWYNSNNGNIFNNSNGASIESNSNDAGIESNSNSGRILRNSNRGRIENNINNGPISSNSNSGIIVGNRNNGEISNNSNNGDIANNIQNVLNITSFSIYSNSNNGNINYNSNDSVSGIDIKYNINNGNIGGTSLVLRTAGIFDTQDNK